MSSHIICKVGIYDIPIVQQQPEFRVDLLKSNIALFGTSMSGKTNFLKLIINNLHKKMDEKKEQIFILDFSGGLLEYKKMPLVAAYFDNSNEEYVKRVFKILETVLKDNIKKLGSKNYSMAGDDQPIHTTFIIDNLNSFVDESRYAAYHEKFGRLCREGRSRGISIVFTASDTKGISKYLLSFEQKIALNLPSDKYTEIFGVKAESIGNIAGRGVANVTERPDGIVGTFNMNSPYEVQCFKASEIENEENCFMRNLNLKYGYSSNNVELYQKHAKKYLTFKQELTYEDYEELRQPLEDVDKKPSDLAIAVGLDYVDFKPVYVDTKESNVWAIYGKKEFGKTNLLSILLEGLAKKKSNARFIFFDDGRKQLKEFYNDFLKKGHMCEKIDEFCEKSLKLIDGTQIKRKLSPLQQFYYYIHEEVASLGDYDGQNADVLEQIYGRENLFSAPLGADKDSTTATIFVIQSKSVFLGSKGNSPFIRYILPELLDIAEESDFTFIFSDVKKITDAEMNAVFNSTLKSVFLLDNIAEFASERGSKSVFGDMDVKSLKEDYARCELGDGYCYDVEADSLKKVKFIHKK